MKGTIWTVTIVIVLVGVMFVGVSGQFADATQTVDIEAEEHTLSDTVPTTLEAADDWQSMVNESEEIRTNEGVSLTRDEDYSIDYDSGEVTSSSEYNGTAVTIDYQFLVVDEDTEGIAAAVSPLAPLMPWLAVIAGVGVILGWIAKLPSGGGSW